MQAAFGFLTIVIYLASALCRQPKIVCHSDIDEIVASTSCDYIILDGLLSTNDIRASSSNLHAKLRNGNIDDAESKSIGIKMSLGNSSDVTSGRFAKELVDLVNEHKFSGIHFDVGLSATEDLLQSYSTMLKNVRGELNRARGDSKKILTVEGSCDLVYLQKRRETIRIIIENVDMILLPTQLSESHPDRIVGEGKCQKFWKNLGVKPKSVIAEVPFYGRIFTLDDRFSSKIGYNRICQLLDEPSWSEMESIGHTQNVASNGTHWIEYDNEKDIRQRVLKIIENGLGGLVVSSVNRDGAGGRCGSLNPLTDVIRSTISPSQNSDGSDKTSIKTIGEHYCSVTCVKDDDHRYDCSRFTQCTFQPELKMFLKKEYKCPVDKVFHKEQGRCSANDTTSPVSSRQSRQYKTERAQVPQCTNAGRFRIPSDCHKYQICQPSAIDSTIFVSEVEHCLPGLVFSDKTKSCLLPSQVPECSGGKGSTQVARCTAVGYFRIPTNCSRYLICYPDAYNNNVFVPDLGECPQGLFFSQSRRACDLPQKVPECLKPTANISAVAKTPTCTASGNFRLGTECNRYISCIVDSNNAGTFITQIVNCPTGRVYSSSARTCLPPDQVPECSSRFPRCTGAGNFLLGTECKRYLSCIPDPNNPGTYIAQIAICPIGLSFSRTAKACMPTATVPECSSLTLRNENIGGAPPLGKDLVCTKPGNFNIANHCDHFLRCIRSIGSTIIAKIEICKNNTVFSPERGICVRSSTRPQCQNGLDKTLSSLVGRQSSTLLCTAAGNFRLSNSCTRFLQCKADPTDVGSFTSSIQTCPNGMAFSPAIRSCRPSNQVPGCGVQAAPVPVSVGTLAIPTCTSAGNFRLGLECDRYLSCVADPRAEGLFITQIVNCPTGQAFSSSAGGCRPANQVPECMALSIPVCSAAGNFRLGNDCSRYLSCIPDPNNPGTFIIQIVNCPPRLAFSSVAGTCLPANQVQDCPVIIPTVTPSTINTTFIPRCARAGFFRIPTDCTKYLSCFPSPINGTLFAPKIVDCPPGLYFSEKLGICQVPALVPECTQALPVSCTAAGLFSIPSDCTKYLECSPDPNGNPNVFIPEVKYCLTGLYFSPNLKTCLRPEDVPECGSGTVTGTTCTTVGLFRIPSDCTKYLRCNPNPDVSAGNTYIPEVVYCYPGLVFSDTKKACLRPNEVLECKGYGHGGSSVVPLQGCTDAGFFPITGDCTHYLACNPDPLPTSSQIFVPSLEKCPHGLFFSPARRFCFRASDVPECRNYLSTGFPTDHGSNSFDGYSNSYEQNDNRYYHDNYYSRENLDASATTFEQPVVFPRGQLGICTQKGYEIVRNDCTKYIICIEEPEGNALIGVMEHCEKGKLFSRAAKKCLPSNEVPECHDGYKQCTEPGYFPFHGDCRKYVVCKPTYNYRMKRFVETCPQGTLFSPRYRTCVPADQVAECFDTDDQYRNKQEIINCPTVGLFPIDKECNSYILCKPDYNNPNVIRSVRQNCPFDHAFSATARKCLPQEQVPECNSIHRDGRPACKNIGNFIYPGSCSKFFRCSPNPNNRRVLQATVEQCRPGMVFNAEYRKCVVDYNGDCRDSDGFYNQDHHRHVSPPASTVECESQHPVGDPNDCSRFYFCSLRNDGTYEAFAFTCPPGYHFNDAPAVRTCVSVSRGNHFSRKCQVRQDEPKAILANSKVCTRQGVMRKPNDCSHFYHCLFEQGEMKQIEFACPQDYMFSEKFSTCSLAGTELPSCTVDRSLISDDEDEQEDDQVPFTCLDEGVFPNDDDCSQYYRCRYNQRQDVFHLSIGKCPQTSHGQQLYFSTETGQCDWPTKQTNVTCQIAVGN